MMVVTELLNDRSWSGKIMSKELHLHFLAMQIGHVHHMHRLVATPYLRQTSVEAGVETGVEAGVEAGT